jgi:hypothetical protein
MDHGAGRYDEVSFDGSMLPTGVYLSVLEHGDQTRPRRMLLIKQPTTTLGQGEVFTRRLPPRLFRLRVGVAGGLPIMLRSER